MALAGCATPHPNDDLTCPAASTWARIESVEDSDLRVVLMDGSLAVLHTADADITQKLGDECYAAPRSGLTPGKEILVDVDAWAESYPVQGWPEHVVLLG